MNDQTSNDASILESDAGRVEQQPDGHGPLDETGECAADSGWPDIGGCQREHGHPGSHLVEDDNGDALAEWEDAESWAEFTAITEEPPVGSTVTGGGGHIWRHNAPGWEGWLSGPAGYWAGVHHRWNIVQAYPPLHLTTDAERKEAGIPEETPEPCPACKGDGEAWETQDQREEAAHRACKAAGMVAVGLPAWAVPDASRIRSVSRRDALLELVAAISDGIEAQEGLGL